MATPYAAYRRMSTSDTAALHGTIMANAVKESNMQMKPRAALSNTPPYPVQSVTGIASLPHVIGDDLGFPPVATLLLAAACTLVLLNHIAAISYLLYSLGVVDCIALSCLLLGGFLVCQHLLAAFRRGARHMLHQVFGMVDSKVLLAKVAEVAQSDPAPSRWLEMYCSMVDNISNLLKENIKMRTIMAGMQADIDHLKSKGKYIHPVRTMYRAVSGASKHQTETPL